MCFYSCLVEQPGGWSGQWLNHRLCCGQTGWVNAVLDQLWLVCLSTTDQSMTQIQELLVRHVLLFKTQDNRLLTASFGFSCICSQSSCYCVTVLQQREWDRRISTLCVCPPPSRLVSVLKTQVNMIIFTAMCKLPKNRPLKIISIFLMMQVLPTYFLRKLLQVGRFLNYFCVCVCGVWCKTASLQTSPSKNVASQSLNNCLHISMVNAIIWKNLFAFRNIRIL